MTKPIIGTTINARYLIESEIGKGGMGTVYRANDSVLERAVAVKLMSNSKLGTEGRARLLREAKLVAKLDHPNIVTVFDAGEYDKNPYIVMQLVEGHTLHEKPPKDLKKITTVISQVCTALEHEDVRARAEDAVGV